MQPDVREFILEHLKEHRKKMGDSPEKVNNASHKEVEYLLFLAQNRRKPADLSTKGSPDVLGGIGN